MYRCLLFAAACIGMTSIDASDWTRFRGPNGTGIGEAPGFQAKFSADDFAFKTKLPGGSGCSSPVVQGERLFILSADATNATRYVNCLNANDGTLLWSREYPSDSHHLHSRNSYASCTPALSENHVFVAWSTPEQTVLKAFDHSGTELWSRDLGTWQSQHGFGTSPIVYGELVILHLSQQANKLQPGEKPGKSQMMAFDLKTGEGKWTAELTSTNVCYSVPFIHTSDSGSDQLICCGTGDGIFAINPINGDRLWAVNDGLFSMRTVASPISAGGNIFASTGSGRYSSNYIVAVKMGGKPELAYKLENSRTFKAPYMTTMLSKGELIFCMYDKGFASCIDAKSGKVYWTERTGAAFSGSPVLINDRVVCVDEKGVVWTFAADKTYRLIGKSELGEGSSATPAVANGKVYFRTDGHLIAVGQ